MTAHVWFIIALVVAIVGALYDLSIKAFADLLTVAAVGLIAVAFIVQTHS